MNKVETIIAANKLVELLQTKKTESDEDFVVKIKEAITYEESLDIFDNGEVDSCQNYMANDPMMGFVIRTTENDSENKYWVMTAIMSCVHFEHISVDPVYMLKQGMSHDLIKWLGDDTLCSFTTKEAAEHYIKKLGGTKKIGDGYITERNAEYIFSKQSGG